MIIIDFFNVNLVFFNLNIKGTISIFATQLFR